MRGAGAANEPKPRRESPNCSQQSLEALLRGEVLILPEFLRGNSGAAASALPGRVCAARCPSPSTPRSTLQAPQPARTRPLTSELPALPTPSGHGDHQPALALPPAMEVCSGVCSLAEAHVVGSGDRRARCVPLSPAQRPGGPCGTLPWTPLCPGGDEGLLCGLRTPSGSAKVNGSQKGMSPAPQGIPGDRGLAGAPGDAPGRPASCSSPSPWRRGGRRGRSHQSSCTCPGRTCADGEEGVRRC